MLELMSSNKRPLPRLNEPETAFLIPPAPGGGSVWNSLHASDFAARRCMGNERNLNRPRAAILPRCARRCRCIEIPIDMRHGRGTVVQKH